MKIQNLIKYYFVLVAVIFSSASLFQNQDVKGFMANTLSIDFEVPKESPELLIVNEEVIAEINEARSQKFLSRETFTDARVTFSEQIPEKHFRSGQVGVEALKIVIHAPKTSFKIDDLKLELNGLEASKIKRASLGVTQLKETEQAEDNTVPIEEKNNKKIEEKSEEPIYEVIELAEGKFKGQELSFGSLTIENSSEEKYELSLYIDFNEEISSGTRVNFTLKEPEDFQITVNEEQISINKHYPLQTPYLSGFKERLPQRIAKPKK